MLFVPARLIGMGRSSLALVTLLVVFACAFSACAQSPKLPVVSAFFMNETGAKSSRFHLEVRSNDGERALGLMYRRSLAADAGMIFVFPDERENSFWMKNTYIPLDMVFVDSGMKVVGIIEHVPPLNELPRSVEKLSMYVLEFAAGTMSKHSIVVGSRLELEGPLPPAY